MLLPTFTVIVQVPGVSGKLAFGSSCGPAVNASLLSSTKYCGGTAVGNVAQAFDSALSAAVADIVGWTLAEGQRYDAANPRLR